MRVFVMNVEPDPNVLPLPQMNYGTQQQQPPPVTTPQPANGQGQSEFVLPLPKMEFGNGRQK